MSDKESNINMSGISAVLSVVIALLFGNWMNNVFDLGWKIPYEWVSLAWMILAGSLFAIVFIVTFAVLIAGILASMDRW
jgi:uncharacterized membrane protein YccF (DUF307 family)